MRADAVETIGCRLTKAGLAGSSEADLLRDFSRWAREAGLPLARAIVVVDTLHPVHEGRVFHWRSEAADEIEVREYGRTNRGGEMAESWRRSPFFHMIETGQSSLRRRIGAGEPCDYPVLAELRAEGQTDWLALIDRFDDTARIGEMDCIYSSWTTDEPSGFDDRHVAALERLAPSLGLAIKSASLARIAETLVETYLGRDAGRRVLAGRIERGIAERIDTALWFSDLRGYTAITGACPPDHVIPLLNDYAEAVISAVEEAGGDVLKLIGDGVLAIFNQDTRAEACRAALQAEAVMRKRVAAVNVKRAGKDLPVTDIYLGLHIGEVFYGNVGSSTRLDFTVVGPAVNEVSRIASMCRSAERGVLASNAFAKAADPRDRDRLVTVGRFALRGIEEPRELFTLVPKRPAGP